MLNQVTMAIFRRDLRRWFGSPAGYVFLVLFVVLATLALFGPARLFQANAANLDPLNEWFPLLLIFFIPAITMSMWAGEKGQGTDELLLTLPATDWQITLGKFLAAGGIYGVGLLFTAPLLVLLGFLGDPDWGLVFCNYLGFGFLGLLMIAAGMVGSQLSNNLTVAFILGAVLCGLLVAAEGLVGAVLPADWSRMLYVFGPVARFEDMARGAISLESVLLFVLLTTAFLFLNLVLLSRRMWRETERHATHSVAQVVCLLVVAVAMTAVGRNAGARLDGTMDRSHSVSAETEELIRALEDDRPVHVQAFVSPAIDVPPEYSEPRRRLLDILDQMEAMGGGAVQVRVVETERFSDEATEAEKNFGIRYQPVSFEDDGTFRQGFIYLGVAFTCGLEEVVIPFLDKGLPVEYEVTRSMRVVANTQRKKVGILDTDVQPFGHFDFQGGQQSQEWEIVRELNLQYETERVSPDEDYAEDLDALIVLMGSSLTQPQLDRLQAWIEAGHPTLLVDDPFPIQNPGLAPSEQKGGPQNPFQQQGPPPEQKGDFRGLLTRLNIHWIQGMGASNMFTGPGAPAPVIAWDIHNPHPHFTKQPELVFVSANLDEESFNQQEAVTAGLQEAVVIFGGAVEEGGNPNLTYVPLMKTGPRSGTIAYGDVFSFNPFFGAQINPQRLHREDARQHHLACRVTGSPAEGAPVVNVFFLADLDMISSNFFDIRRQGVEGMEFDNITLFLNCVDELAGDTRFIELRKRRARHRTLTRLEAREREFEQSWLTAKQDAEGEAQAQLDAAQEKLNKRVAEIERRPDLDENAKAIQVQTVRDAEERLLAVQQRAIEDEKQRVLDAAQQQMIHGKRRIRNFYRFTSVIITPIPALLLGIYCLTRRVRRERATTRR